MATVKEKMTSLANQFRQYLDISVVMSLEDMINNVKEVFNKGKQSEYDRFWNICQENGERKNYNYAFSGRGWTNDNFHPKYDIVPTNAQYMFQAARIEKPMENANIDFSKCTDARYMFQANTTVKELGVLDFRGTASPSPYLSYLFQSCSSLETVEKIYVKETHQFGYAFDNCTALKNIIFRGVIASSINIRWSPLNKASITSIINVLSGSVNGMTLTLSKTAVNNAFGINIDDESTYPEGSEYYNLRHSKDNWTISYL